MQSGAIAQTLVNRLEPLESDIRRQWNAADATTQTRHFVVDNLLPPELAQAIHEALPQDAGGFFNRESFRKRKKTLTDLSKQPAILSAITYAMQDPAVVAKIQSGE